MSEWNVKKDCYTRKSSNLTAGTHIIYSEFRPDNDEYGASKSEPVTITIEKIATTLQLTGINDYDGYDLADLPTDTDGINITITPTVKDQWDNDITGTLPMKVYCNSEQIYPYDGSSNDSRPFTYLIDTDGDYNFYGVVEENYKYKESRSSETFIHINDSNLKETSITTTTNNTPIYSVDNITIASKVTYNNTELPDSEQDKITTTITDLNGEQIHGKQTITRLFNPSTYTVQAEYPTTSTYTSSNKTTTFTVLKTPVHFTDYYPEDYQYEWNSGEDFNVNITLLDIHDNPVAGKPVRLQATVNGATHNYTTTSTIDGLCTVPVNLKESGTVEFKWIYNGNTVYESNTGEDDSYYVTLKNITSKIELLSGDNVYQGWYYATRLTDSEDNPIINSNVTYSITTPSTGQTNTYNTTTDDNGVSKLQINMMTGRTWNIKAKYDGETGVMEGSTLEGTITVNEPVTVTRQPSKLKEYPNSVSMPWNELDPKQLGSHYIRCV